MNQQIMKHLIVISGHSYRNQLRKRKRKSMKECTRFPIHSPKTTMIPTIFSTPAQTIQFSKSPQFSKSSRITIVEQHTHTLEVDMNDWLDSSVKGESAKVLEFATFHKNSWLVKLFVKFKALRQWFP